MMSDAEILAAPEIESVRLSNQSKWDREKTAFRRLLPTLLMSYRDQYVAIHEETVVDSGLDQIELARQVYRTFGYVPIYVGLVTDKRRPVAKVPSPRVNRSEA